MESNSEASPAVLNKKPSILKIIAGRKKKSSITADCFTGSILLHMTGKDHILMSVQMTWDEVIFTC